MSVNVPHHGIHQVATFRCQHSYSFLVSVSTDFDMLLVLRRKCTEGFSELFAENSYYLLLPLETKLTYLWDGNIKQCAESC